MASPQIENGYTKIANELLEAYARIRISGEENQIFWFIVRKTYGFNKKEDGISLSQFVLATGLKKPNICRTLSKLIKKNMIIKIDKGGIVRYRIQKDYSKWQPLSKLIILSKLITPIIKSDNGSVIKSDTHKRKEDTKETLTKEVYSAEFEEFYKKYPKKRRKPEALKAWKRLNNKQKQEASISVENYTDECQSLNRDPEFIMYPQKFLNKDKEIWKDYLSIPKKHKIGERQSTPSTKEKEFERQSEEMAAKLKEEGLSFDEIREKIAEFSQKFWGDTEEAF